MKKDNIIEKINTHKELIKKRKLNINTKMETKTVNYSKTTNFSTRILLNLTHIYIFLILCIFPLYYENKYYNMDNAKMKFFVTTTVLFGLLWLIAFILKKKQISKYKFMQQLKQRSLSITDCFALLYLAAVGVSVILSPYQEAVIWGFDGWYMGLVAQVCFVAIYFVVSRCWKWNQIVINSSLITAFLVFLLAVFMRFQIDPLGMYDNLGTGDILRFLSTIGQATWYSSYMVILFPLGVFAFWYTGSSSQYLQEKDNKTKYCIKRIFYGIFTAVGFMTMVTQNSDSAFIALGIMVVVLFWFSMESNEKYKCFLQVLILCFASFKVIGILQKAFPENMVPLDSISIFCSQSNIVWACLLITIVVYSIFLVIEKYKEMDISQYIFIRKIVVGIVMIAAFSVVLYIFLNTIELLPESVRSKNNYLLFQENWGNNRGGTWILAANLYKEFDIAHKLFGCGPDGFAYAAYHLYGDALITKWGQEQILVCAHNEWLNMLINLGLIGSAAYIGIFISAIIQFCKYVKVCPRLIAVILSVFCYMGHNIFCYQQIICTPIIFIFIGMGEADVLQYRVYQSK